MDQVRDVICFLLGCATAVAIVWGVAYAISYNNEQTDAINLRRYTACVDNGGTPINYGKLCVWAEDEVETGTGN